MLTECRIARVGSAACHPSMSSSSGRGTGVGDVGFVKGGRVVPGIGTPICTIKLLKKGGGTTPIVGRRNWLSREFELHSNVLT